ncbi:MULTISPECIES: DUF4314 domain-containing protein [Vibrio harveyi group]|uniref:DUF4314 domain-containing protein n=1 Tax=Vibrio harveyi group TaxID=717610 RepID=UPI0015F5E79C|nr:DUF4314 domain-containing protein [Vibrio alginolyticus]EJE4208676.1 DUF4314 domain-containing protein [Vibrio parahaemolyticus]HDM8060784.1 DUF4314 domain-containing protein [Vibrio harveyi]
MLNNRLPSHHRVNTVKALYPKGTRIEMITMVDEDYPVPVGTKGTVSHVDDIGSLIMQWDNGSRLNVCPLDGDTFKII